MSSKCLVPFRSFLYTDLKLCVTKKVVFGNKLVIRSQYIQLFPHRTASTILYLNGHGILDKDLIYRKLHFLKRRVWKICFYLRMPVSSLLGINRRGNLEDKELEFHLYVWSRRSALHMCGCKSQPSRMTSRTNEWDGRKGLYPGVWVRISQLSAPKIICSFWSSFKPKPIQFYTKAQLKCTTCMFGLKERFWMTMCHSLAFMVKILKVCGGSLLSL